MRIFALILLTSCVIFGTFGLSYGLSNNFLIIAALVLTLHLIGLFVIQWTQKQGKTQIMSYFTLFELLLLVPCFATLEELTKPMSNLQWSRYVSTLSVTYIVLLITVTVSYRHYIRQFS
ncbi:MAG: hypothetical protein RR642_15930 [Solibacillus sp.]